MRLTQVKFQSVSISTLLLGAIITMLSGTASATYLQDFSFADGTTALGDGSVIAGDASVQSNQLRLTQNMTSQNSAFWIGSLAGSSNGWNASFDYSISSTHPTDPADGFSFNYGNIAAGALSSQAEEGFPGVTPHISFEMDTWRNGDTEVGPAIAVDGVNVPGGFINGDILANLGSIMGTIDISMDAAGVVSFSSTGAITNANFASLATGFTPNDAFNFVIAARTGGAYQEVLIDNLQIRTATVPEPTTLALFGLGLAGLGFARRKKA